MMLQTSLQNWGVWGAVALWPRPLCSGSLTLQQHKDVGDNGAQGGMRGSTGVRQGSKVEMHTLITSPYYRHRRYKQLQ